MCYRRCMHARHAATIILPFLLASCTGDQQPMEDDHAMHGGTSSPSGTEASSDGHMDHTHPVAGTGAAETYLPGAGMRISALPEALKSQVIDVPNGAVIHLDPTMVRRTINGTTEVLQYGYNGMVPGPVLRVEQGSSFTVETTNNIDQPTTIHWHGLRLDNKSDGTPGLTQDPIQPGQSFTYTVTVPDAGVYWYHPHVREDIQMDLGLYGNIVVLPKGQSMAETPNPTTLMLDDILLADDGSLMPYGKNNENYSLMGRFGNVLLVNGEVQPDVTVGAGTQRLYLTNAANVRTYRLSIDGASMKLVGGDIGFGVAHDVKELVLGPAERAIVDVTFPAAGTYALLHRSDATTSTIAVLTVGRAEEKPATAVPADDLPIDLAAERLRDPDHLLRITLMGGHKHGRIDSSGIEWEDAMPEMNALSHKGNTQWRLVDDDTGKVNMDIAWRFKKGTLSKIRVKNDFESMQHPIHFHGQRFLVISSNGEDVDDGQWKDTYLLKSGETADLLLELSNPGIWMFHCHNLPHARAGLMTHMMYQGVHSRYEIGAVAPGLTNRPE